MMGLHRSYDPGKTAAAAAVIVVCVLSWQMQGRRAAASATSCQAAPAAHMLHPLPGEVVDVINVSDHNRGVPLRISQPPVAAVGEAGVLLTVRSGGCRHAGQGGVSGSDEAASGVPFSVWCPPPASVALGADSDCRTTGWNARLDEQNGASCCVHIPASLLLEGCASTVVTLEAAVFDRRTGEPACPSLACCPDSPTTLGSFVLVERRASTASALMAHRTLRAPRKSRGDLVHYDVILKRENDREDAYMVVSGTEEDPQQVGRSLAEAAAVDAAVGSVDWFAEHFTAQMRAARQARAELLSAVAELGRKPRRVILGAGTEDERNTLGRAGNATWIATEANSLDVVSSHDFSVVAPVRTFVAEHVWEHLSLADGLLAAGNCFDTLQQSGNFRIAVPDWHRHFSTREAAAARARDMADGHAVQFTAPALVALLRAAGFDDVHLLEWRTGDGSFHSAPWHDGGGRIERSARHDHKRGGTSLIVDAIRTDRRSTMANQRNQSPASPPEEPEPGRTEHDTCAREAQPVRRAVDAHVRQLAGDPQTLSQQNKDSSGAVDYARMAPFLAYRCTEAVAELRTCIENVEAGTNIAWSDLCTAAPEQLGDLLDGLTKASDPKCRMLVHVVLAAANAHHGRGAAACTALLDAQRDSRTFAAPALLRALVGRDGLPCHPDRTLTALAAAEVASLLLQEWPRSEDGLRGLTAAWSQLHVREPAPFVAVVRPDDGAVVVGSVDGVGTSAGPLLLSVSVEVQVSGFSPPVDGTACLWLTEDQLEGRQLGGCGRVLGASYSGLRPGPYTVEAALFRHDGLLIHRATASRFTLHSPDAVGLTHRWEAPEGVSVDPIEVADAAVAAAHTRAVSPTKLCVQTIALNGAGHFKRQLAMLRDLPHNVQWYWSIAEGVAEGRAAAESPYSSSALPEWSHTDGGRSIDGLSELMDEVVAKDRRVFVVRPPEGRTTWRDKIEQANAALISLLSLPRPDECLLLQLDLDEYWQPWQLVRALQLFQAPSPTGDLPRCAYFDCHMFVAPGLVSSERNTYGHRDDYEWLRMWALGAAPSGRRHPARAWRWASHAPPILVRATSAPGRAGAVEQLWGTRHCMSQAETARAGLVFTHHAYVDEFEVAFKEAFYGYDGALSAWSSLRQAVTSGIAVIPVDLASRLPWVPQHSLGTPPQYSAVGYHVPVAPRHPDEASSGVAPEPGCGRSRAARRPALIIDGAIWGLKSTTQGGISRVWTELVPRVAARADAAGIDTVVLQRGNAPIPPFNLTGRVSRAVSIRKTVPVAWGEADGKLLAEICRSLGAIAFVSTYYTFPTRAPAGCSARIAAMVHDMIPEQLGWMNQSPEWRAKHRMISAADALVFVSDSSASAFTQYFRQLRELPDVPLHVAQNGLSSAFHPLSSGVVSRRIATRGLTTARPFVLLVGSRLGYKGGLNAMLGLAAQTAATRENGLQLWVVGPTLEVEELQKARELHLSVVFIESVNDELLAALYSSAVALLSLSVAEGFGLPTLEAMACGCPVVVDVGNAAAHEVGGDAPLFVDPRNHSAIAEAVHKLLDNDGPERLLRRERGLRQADKFREQGWTPLSDAVTDALAIR